MRLLLVSADYPPTPSGEANHCFYLAKHLARSGAEVHVLTSSVTVDRSDSAIAVHPLMRSWSWMDLPRLAWFFRKCEPDAVILVFLGAMYHHHPMMTFAASICRYLLPKTKFVTQFEHLGVFSSSKPLTTRLGRKVAEILAKRTDCDYEYGTLLRDSDAIISLSEMHLTSLLERLPRAKDKAHLIPPPPIMRVCENRDSAREATRKRLGIGANDTLLIYYGYIYGGKGVETLLEAFQLLRARGRNSRLLMVGGPLIHVASDNEAERSNAYFTKVQGLASALGLGDSVLWTGAVSANDDTASTYLFAADIGVLPFDNGLHLNNSSFAALSAHGLPVVSTRVATTEAAFRDGHNVILCPPKSPQDLAEALDSLITSPNLREHLALGVNALSREWFSWETAAQRTLATTGTAALNSNATLQSA